MAGWTAAAAVSLAIANGPISPVLLPLISTVSPILATPGVLVVLAGTSLWRAGVNAVRAKRSRDDFNRAVDKINSGEKLKRQKDALDRHFKENQ